MKKNQNHFQRVFMFNMLTLICRKTSWEGTTIHHIRLY
jgi:hypothetical protein